ncbi:hypothetical protein [Reyranella sp.]|uniref:hypothetical protein n=1 Tax=Reyranella sp. TaxID=1929291 RepID=UPI0011F4A44D|nr:hypothetical protein [Reyranella sp.]TAJ89698.1 MAG: hypothetical protein EPO50_04865 [Reyranella sp.]
MAPDSLHIERGDAQSCALTPRASDIAIQQATGFVVISRWRDKSPLPPYKESLEFSHYDTLNEAWWAYAEYEQGEWERAEPVALMACKRGVPFATILCADPSLIAGDAA